MSGPFGSSQWMYNAGGEFYPYPISNSLRFDGSSKLTMTPPSASNRTKFTVSFWAKRAPSGADQRIFEGWGGSTSNWTVVAFTDVDTLQIQNRVSGSAVLNYVSSAKYRDVGAWYHIVIRVDLAGTGLKVWVNGSEVTQWTSSTFSSADTFFNSSSYNLNIGYYQGTATQYLQGYLADVHFVDNQALSATDFGELKQGVWIPKAYSGSYGTNGFHLDFADGTSAATLGYDAAGSNNFTPSGIATSDQMLDSPTNNFCTFNELDKGTGHVNSEGNLKAATTIADFYMTKSTVVMSTARETTSKWYAEFYYQYNTDTSYVAMIGIAEAGTDPNSTAYQSTTTYSYYAYDGAFYDAGTDVAYGATYAPGDIIGVSFDEATGALEFFKNGVSQTVAKTGLSGEFVFCVADGGSGGSVTIVANFGQDSSFAGYKTRQNHADENGYGDFYYTPPTGALALCTQNLPTPTFDPKQGASPQDGFNVYTDTGANILSTAQGDYSDGLFWIKDYQNPSTDHQLLNTVTNTVLESNTTDAERAYSIPSGSSVAWAWKANGAGVSNTDGTISSTVSANTKAGFSIVSWTGTGANATVGHGLGVVPAMVIAKKRDAAAGNWAVHHKDLTDASYYLWLNSTQAQAVGTNIWNSTAPSSSVFSIGTSSNTNTSSVTYIAYCFAEKEGFSKFGSYTGTNSSTLGPFVYLGFRPAFLLLKKVSSGTNANWVIRDSARDPYNPNNDRLFPHLNNGTGAVADIDFLSNGFKIRTGEPSENDGGEFVYMAFAEQPFKYSNAR